MPSLYYVTAVHSFGMVDFGPRALTNILYRRVNECFNLEEIATKGFSMEMGSTISGLSHQIKLPQNFSLEGPLRGPQITPGGQWEGKFQKNFSLKGGSNEISVF